MSNGTDISQITRSVEDAVTFPILTKEVDGYAAGAGDLSWTGAPGGSSIGRLARETIRGVLGWRYRSNDYKGFVAALSKTFQLKEVEGHTEWDFKPQHHMIKADLGEVTGAQASIYERAKVAMDQSLPLLDRLEPLRADADKEDTEAMRAVIRTEFTELVQELGVVGGPRVQRIDSLFRLLLGDKPQTSYSEPEKVAGQIGLLRARLGLERERVNTLQEEQMFTNFLILVDYINSLHQTWDAQRNSFARDSAKPFLGTELVLMSQILDVVAESVHETYAAMDSVNFGAAERQTTELTLRLDEQDRPITVAELLSWVQAFASEEAPQLIEDAGKDGVVAIRFTLARLLSLTTQALEISRKDTGNPTRGFHSLRVQRGIEEVKLQLTAAAGRANKLDRSVIRLQEQTDPDPGQVALGPVPPAPAAAPVIFGIVPDKLEKPEVDSPTQDTFDAVIFGENFQSGASVRIGTETDGIHAGLTTVKSSGQIETKLTIDEAAKLGKYDVTVINPGPGGKSGVKKSGFELVPPPTPRPKVEKVVLANFSPTTGFQNSTLEEFTVNGRGFTEGATLTVEDLTVKDTNVSLDGRRITAKLIIPSDAETGDHDVIVTIRGKANTFDDPFVVDSPATTPTPGPTQAILLPTSVVEDNYVMLLETDKEVENAILMNQAEQDPRAIPGSRLERNRFSFNLSGASEGSRFDLIVRYKDPNERSELFENAVQVRGS